MTTERWRQTQSDRKRPTNWSRKKWMIPAIMACCLMMSSCDGPGSNPTLKTASGCAIQEYGNGVFFFDCASGFGPALSEFAKTHDVATVTSFTNYADAQAKYGTSGYWVVTRNNQSGR